MTPLHQQICRSGQRNYGAAVLVTIFIRSLEVGYAASRISSGIEHVDCQSPWRL
jgi:hypothetical protein